MEDIIINKQVFKVVKLNARYYINKYGSVYSTYSHKIIKNLKRKVGNKEYYYVDMWVDGKQRHIPIHRLVYSCWVRKLNDCEQVNHKDDNSLNNYYLNLYAGTQKDNVLDCIENSHRVGNLFYLTVYDKKISKTITFCPANRFIEYSGHTCKNGNIKRMFSRRWFTNRFSIIDFKHINNISELKDVETKDDECNPVG